MRAPRRLLALVTLPLLLAGCPDEKDEGGCVYVDLEAATCSWVEEDGEVSLQVEGASGAWSTGVTDDTTCYAESAHDLDEAFDCMVQELEEGGCDPDVVVVDMDGCSLEVY